MEPQHHSKLMLVSGIFLVLIAIGIGLIVIRGKNEAPKVPIAAEKEYRLDSREAILEATTATRASPENDPEAKELKEMTTAEKTGGDAGRAKLVEMTSAH